MSGRVIQGHRVASGLAEDCPWPGGSVRRQLPLMALHGVPVDDLFAGTLNIALDRPAIPWPDWAAFDFILDWRPPDNPTHFRLHPLMLRVAGETTRGWSYRKQYPPGYQSRDPQPDNVIEVLAPKMAHVSYGTPLQLCFVAPGQSAC